MSESKSSSKWASEAYDFLKLFQRIGHQLSGLIMLEIGWALFLNLIVKLSQLEGSVPIIGLPWFTFDKGIFIRDFRVTSIFTFGAFFIALIWFFISKVYLYVYIPIIKIAKQISIVFTHLFFGVLMVFVGIPITAISIPIERMLIKKWEKQLGEEKIKQLVAKHGAKTIYKLALEKIPYSSNKILSPMVSLYTAILIKLVSVGNIGLAPFYSHSFAEDQYAKKAPLQIFASAIGRLRARLRELRAVRFINFMNLPEITSIKTEETARFVRKWFGLDALLWGSYLSANPPHIWLNIEHALIETAHRKEKNEGDPFDILFNLDEYTVIIDQDDPVDTYIALIITLVYVLRSRRIEKLTLYPKGVDKLYYSHADEDALITNLVREALFAVKGPMDDLTLQYSVKHLLIDLAGKWISKQLEGGGFDKYSRNYSLLRDVAAKCVELNPQNPNSQYRLAALECLVENEQAARDAIKAALKEDKELKWIDPIHLESIACVDIATLSGLWSSEKPKLAKIVVYVARALATGKKHIKESIRKELEESKSFQLKELIDKDEPLSTVEIILFDMLGINFRQVKE